MSNLMSKIKEILMSKFGIPVAINIIDILCRHVRRKVGDERFTVNVPTDVAIEKIRAKYESLATENTALKDM